MSDGNVPTPSSALGTSPARRCAFIAGNGPFHGADPFCGAPAEADSPYCAEHHVRCYTASKKSPVLKKSR